MELFVYTFKENDLVYRALSPLAPERVQTNGLPSEGVLGQINALLPSMTPDQFEENEDFKSLVHDICSRYANQVESVKAEAAVIGQGELILFDLRAGRVTGQTGKEDVLGRFEVKAGRIVPESYEPNPDYRILTDNGPVSLPPEIETELMTVIMSKAETSQQEK